MFHPLMLLVLSLTAMQFMVYVAVAEKKQAVPPMGEIDGSCEYFKGAQMKATDHCGEQTWKQDWLNDAVKFYTKLQEMQEKQKVLDKSIQTCEAEIAALKQQLKEKGLENSELSNKISNLQKTRIAAELSEKSRQPDAATRTTTPTPTTTTTTSSTTTTVRPTIWTPPPGAVTFSTGTYFFIEKELTWTSAREHCQSLGMDLVAIETREENEALANHARTVFRWRYTWTSGCYSRREDAVVWRSTGRRLTYTNWFAHNNYGNMKNEERCVALDQQDKSWEERTKSYKRPSICERT